MRGEYTMIYTAADADGTQLGVSFRIVVLATALQVNGNAAPEKPGTPTVSRKTFSEPTNPALKVTWTAPASGATPTGYEAQYRKKAAEGEDPAAWTAYSGTLGATATSLTLSDLEAGATYEVQVRALNNDERGAWSDTGSGRANRPPTGTGVGYLNATLEYDQVWTNRNPMSAHFVDADGDTLTYSVTPADTRLADAWADGDVLKINAKNAGETSVTYRASDPYGGVSADAQHSFTVTASETRSLPENSPGETMVGERVQGNPHNGETLTYTLTGELATSGHFYIKPRGRIRVKSGAALDYETKSSYTGKVEYSVGGIATAIDVTVNLTDVEAGKPGTPTLARTQFSEPTNPALDVTWTAAPANGLTISGYQAQYRKKAAQGEDPAEWTAYSGALGATATSLTLTNLEAGATYEAQVRAVTSQEGEGPWSDTGTGRANRPPTATSAAFNGGTFPVGSIADFRETGNGALGVMFADADGDALTYAAAAEHPALLGVSLSGAAGSAHLQVTLLNQGSSKVTYTATDPYGGSVTRTATIGITANESRSIAENSAAGTAVGDPVTGTPYNGVALSYTLKGKAKDSGKFAIDSSTGQISLKQGATLDYETDDCPPGKRNIQRPADRQVLPGRGALHGRRPRRRHHHQHRGDGRRDRPARTRRR